MGVTTYFPLFDWLFDFCSDWFTSFPLLVIFLQATATRWQRTYYCLCSWGLSKSEKWTKNYKQTFNTTSTLSINHIGYDHAPFFFQQSSGRGNTLVSTCMTVIFNAYSIDFEIPFPKMLLSNVSEFIFHFLSFCDRK